MAVTASFMADFSSFNAAIERATVKIRDLDTGGLRVAKTLDKMSDSFSGRRVVQDAQLAVKAVEAIGGASKLTAREQDKLNDQITEALAKYKALGQVAPDSLVKMAEATKQVEQQMTLAQRAGVALTGTLGQVAGGFALGSLATAGIRGLKNFASEAIDTAGALTDASTKTGLTTDSLQQMAYAAGQAGGTLDDFTQASFKLGVNLAGGGSSVKGAVDALGLSFEDLRTQTPDQQFKTIADALGQVGDASERNRIGVELFGKSFASIAAAIDKNYDDMIKKAPVAGAAQVKALDDATDAAKHFADELKAGGLSFAGNVILGFGKITGSVTDAATAIHKYFADVETIMRGAGRAAGAIGPQPADVAAIKSYAEQLKEAQTAALSLSDAQKTELNAALEHGVVSAGDLEQEFFKVAGSLTIYQKNQKDAEEATKAHAATMDRAAGDIEKYVTKLLAAREELERFRRASDEIPDDPWKDFAVGVQPNLESTSGLTAQQQRDLMLGTNPAGFGVGGFIPTVQQMQQYKKAAREILTIWQEMTLDMAQSTSDAFGNMLTGIRSFKDGVTDIWRGLQRSVSQYISAIVRQWLDGVALMGSAGGGGGGWGGGGGGGLAMAGGGLAMGTGGGAGGGGWGGGTNPFHQLAAGSGWAMYGAPAVVGGIAGFSTGYASGSRWAGVGSGALAGGLAGVPYAGATGGWSVVAGAGAGAVAGFFGGSLGKAKNAKEIDAQRTAYVNSLTRANEDNFGTTPGSWYIQDALGIFARQNRDGSYTPGSDQNLQLWRDFASTTDPAEFANLGVIIDGMVQQRARQVAASADPNNPDNNIWKGAKGSRGGIPFYANEAFGLNTPHLAVVGDSSEPENVVKNSTLAKIAGGGSDALHGFLAGLRSDLARDRQDQPRVMARALASALLQAGVTR